MTNQPNRNRWRSDEPGVRTEGTTFSMVPHALLMTVNDPQAIRLYAVLGIWTDNHSGEAWPSRATIADVMGVSVKTVDRAAEILIAAGWLTKERRYNDNGSRTSNGWMIHRGGREADFPGVGKQGSQGVGKQTSHKLDPVLTRPIELEKIASSTRIDPHWEALCAEIGQPTDATRSSFGKVLKQVKDHPVEEIHRRAGILKAVHPSLTIHSLGKWWEWADSPAAEAALLSPKEKQELVRRFKSEAFIRQKMREENNEMD